jgi:hypothetical protein
MSFRRIEKPSKKCRMPKLLTSPPERREGVKVVENRLEPFELGIVVDELLEGDAQRRGC